MEQHEQEKRQTHYAEGHRDGKILVVGAETEFLFQRGMNLVVGLIESLRHIACAHAKPKMLLDDMERGPRKLNALRQRPAIGVVETAVEVVFEQGRGKAGMKAWMLPVVVVGYALLNVSDILIGQGLHALGILAQVLGSQVTCQCGFQVFAVGGGAFKRQSAALGPTFLQLLAAVIESHEFESCRANSRCRGRFSFPKC